MSGLDNVFSDALCNSTGLPAHVCAGKLADTLAVFGETVIGVVVGGGAVVAVSHGDVSFGVITVAFFCRRFLNYEHVTAIVNVTGNIVGRRSTVDDDFRYWLP